MPDNGNSDSALSTKKRLSTISSGLLPKRTLLLSSGAPIVENEIEKLILSRLMSGKIRVNSDKITPQG